MGASVGERGNVQTRGGNWESTISLLGCSTSVALTTGPTDDVDEEEEEEEEEKKKKTKKNHLKHGTTSAKLNLSEIKL